MQIELCLLQLEIKEGWKIHHSGRSYTQARKA